MNGLQYLSPFVSASVSFPCVKPSMIVEAYSRVRVDKSGVSSWFSLKLGRIPPRIGGISIVWKYRNHRSMEVVKAYTIVGFSSCLVLSCICLRLHPLSGLYVLDVVVCCNRV